MNYSQKELTDGSLNYANKYLNQEKLGSDEKLQMLSCAYAHLYLKAASQCSMKELGEAHLLIAECFDKLGESAWSQDHRSAASSYLKNS